MKNLSRRIRLVALGANLELEKAGENAGDTQRSSFEYFV